MSAIALPSFLNQANKSREAEAASNVGAANRAQQAYFVENNRFADDMETLDLGIESTENYTYTSGTTGSGLQASAVTTAVGAGRLKGYAGRVWLEPSPGGSVLKSINCPGTAGQLPAGITGVGSTATVCP